MTAERDRAERSRTNVPVLIVGAGPTGLILALWLTRLGVRIRIIDKVAEPGTTSRALVVHARTLEFYRQLGIADEVVEGGIKFEAVNLWVKSDKSARRPRRLGQGLSPFPFMLIFPRTSTNASSSITWHAGVTVERPTELSRLKKQTTNVEARPPPRRRHRTNLQRRISPAATAPLHRPPVWRRLPRRHLRPPLLRRRRRRLRPGDQRRTPRRPRRSRPPRDLPPRRHRPRPPHRHHPNEPTNRRPRDSPGTTSATT